MPELLPPAVQDFVVNSAGYVAGLDAMVAENAKLSESIGLTTDELKAMEMAAAKSAEASAAAVAQAGRARDAKGRFVKAGGETGVSAAPQRELSAAEKAAAEAAKVEADMLALLAETDVKAAEASKVLTESMGAQTKAMTVNREAAAATQSKSSELAAGMNKVGGATIAASAVFAGYGVKSAMDYQSQIVKLKTSAGEAGDIVGGKLTGDLKLVSDTLLKMSVQTGTSTSELTSGMYMVESAGYHGKQGLDVMRVAAEGARAEQAPLKDVTNALTTVMRDFNVQPAEAARVMNTMTVAVGQGKMSMADFASAVGTVSPIAQKAGIAFGEMSGALATLTQHGATAHGAVDDLNAVIRGMQAPNLQAVKEMDRLGISATNVSKNLGSRGLMGTLEMYTKAIAAHTRGGQLLISTFNNSRTAAANADAAFKGLPPNVQKVAASFLKGSMSAKDWVKYTMGLPPLTANLANQFATAEKRAHGFSDLLRSGSPLAQSYAQALTKMTGGQNAYRAALQLTGANLDETQKNVAATTAAWNKGGKDVKGFAEASQTLKFKMDQAKAALNAVAITVGNTLLPPIMKLLGFFEKHPLITKALAVMVAGFLAAAAAVKVFSVISGFIKMITAIKEIAAVTKIWTAVQWLLDAAMDANPIALVVVAIAALVAAVIYAYTHFKWFHDLVNKIFSWIKSHWPLLLAILTGPIGLAVLFIIKHWNAIKDAFLGAVNWVVDFVKSHWQLLLAIITGPVGLAVYFIHKYWDDITGAVSTAVSWVVDFVKAHWPLLLAIVTGPIGLAVLFIKSHWDQIIGFFQSGVDKVKSIVAWFGSLPGKFTSWFTGVWNAIVAWGARTVIYIAAIPGKIYGYFSGLYGDMLGVGKNIVIGIWNGLVSLGSWLYRSLMNWVSSMIPGPIKHVLGISSPSKLMHGFGQNIGQGLVNGMVSKYDHVKAAAEGLAKTAAAGVDKTVQGQVKMTLSAHAGGLSGQLVASMTQQGGARGYTTQAGTTVIVNMNIAGTVTAQRNLEKGVQRAVLQANVRNPTNTLSLPKGR